jgi:S-adenosylmethionine synthetase
MSYLFTSESVSEGHPDKVADQISDAVLDAMLAFDPHSRVACETLTTTGLAVVSGEITTNSYIDIQETVRETIRRIGYTKSEYKFDADSCAVMSTLHEQSPDIAQGVNEGEGVDKEQGAGDQGMMFGYAVNETAELMPIALSLSHSLVAELANIRKAGKVMKYLRPDAKSQVTIQYSDGGKVERIHTIVLSTQHDDFAPEKKMLDQIKKDVLKYLIPVAIPKKLQKLIDSKTIFHINPTGKFVIGGPHGDTGLTGRKIIVDTYGGKGAHGGGAFSGKDPSKVDRSAAYAARHIAKNLVAAGVTDEVLVQVAYAIGVAKPVSLTINTYGKSNVKMSDGEIAKKVSAIFDMRPKALIERLKLKTPIYSETAAYGHMGRKPQTVTKKFKTTELKVSKGRTVKVEKVVSQKVELFTWEKLDYVEEVKSAFRIK